MPALTNDSPYLNQSKEDFSFAYVRAVAAAADCHVTKRERDFPYGIDGTVFQYNCNGQFPTRGLDFQLKATHQPKLHSDKFSFELEVSNYESLRTAGPDDPAVLIVVIVPEDVKEWALHSEENLSVRRCGYWRDLRGLPSTENDETIVVHMDRTQVWGVEEVVELMDRVTDDKF